MIHLVKCTSEFCWWPQPLSDLIILTFPLYTTNFLKLMMNESVLREYTTSMCMALLDRQLYRAPYLLTSFQPSFRRNEPNTSTPQYTNGASSLILSLGKSAIFVAEDSLTATCTWHTSRWYLWQKSYIMSPKNQRILFGSLSCLDQHELLVHDTNILPTQQFCKIFCINTGCCISFGRANLWILPPTLHIPPYQWMGLTLLCCCMTSSNFLFP